MRQIIALIVIIIFSPSLFAQIGYLGGNFTLGDSYRLDYPNSATAYGYGINYEILFSQKMKNDRIGSFSFIATYDNILKRAYDNNFELLSLRLHQFGIGVGFDFLNYLTEDYPHIGFAGNTILKYQFRDLDTPRVLTVSNMIGFSFKMNDLYKGKFV